MFTSHYKDTKGASESKEEGRLVGSRFRGLKNLRSLTSDRNRSAGNRAVEIRRYYVNLRVETGGKFVTGRGARW